MIYFSFDHDRMGYERRSEQLLILEEKFTRDSFDSDNKTNNMKELIMDFPRAKSRLLNSAIE